MTNIYTVVPQQLAEWLEKDEVVLVDVRDTAEYRNESIASVQNVPLSSVAASTVNIADDETRKVVVYCKAGIRSMMACQKLKADEVSYDMWNLDGGIEGWKALGFPVVKPRS